MKNKKFKKWKNLTWLCRPYWKYGKVYVILSLIFFVGMSPLHEIVYVYSPEIIVRLLNEGSPFSHLVVVALIIAGATFLKDVLRLFFEPYFTKKQTEINVKVKRNIYVKAMEIDYKYVDSPEYYNEYAWAMNEYVQQTNRAFDFSRRFLSALFSVVTLFSIVMVIGPWLIVIEIIQLILQKLLLARRNKLDIQMKNETVPVERRLSCFHRLFYLKEYSADIKTTPLKRFAFDGYDKSGKEQVDINTKYEKKGAVCYITQEFLFIVTEFVLTLYLVHSIIEGNIVDAALYITMHLSFYRLDSNLYNLIQLMEEANNISMNADKIREFFDIKSNIETKSADVQITEIHDPFAVRFKNVGFSYENSDFAISDLNLDIKPGEKIAIVGENGAGKSTFVKLLMRLYDVTDGDILINGISIKDYDVELLRQHVGVAFQNTNVYAMSFADNVSLFNKISEEELERISKEYELDSILEKNHADFNSELTREFSPDGIILSGGEVQKIALARLMTKKWGLLLLDEPSSALDPLAEYKLSKLILSTANRATTIIVAHRLSTIRDADRIIVMERGKLEECGTHDELMEKHGKYYEMFTKQAENYIN